MIYIGIDPGLSGAVASVNTYMDPAGYRWADAPVGKTGARRVLLPAEMVKVLAEQTRYFDSRDVNSEEPSIHVYIEKVHAMKKQGVTSMFNFGMGYGIWIGIVVALQIPYTLVTPQAWKREVMAGMPKGKGASVVRAQQLFPDAELITPRGRKIDGRADALLIAEYGRRQQMGQTTH